MSTPVPEKTKILVVGGGPGGSYAASCLVREGFEVTLLESDKFPRYHIGESMLASMKHFLRFIDLEDTFKNYGFHRKNGAAFRLHASKAVGYTDFLAVHPDNYSWNVIRSISDELLLRHAASQGANVIEETRVQELEFDANERPIAALWKNKAGETGKISFEFLVDASGRNGLMSTKYLKNRTFNQSLKNVATWGYWRNGTTFGKGTNQESAPLADALNDQSGWAWYIPLHDGTHGVGIVMHENAAKAKKALLENKDNHSFYMSELKKCPQITELLKDAELVTDRPGPVIKSASDYSYSASSYAGPGYRIVGDAGCFIDPYFSSGVHLANSSALAAACSISASIRGEATEEEAAKWHTARVGTSYTRFLVVVLSAYQQVRHQEDPVLADVDELNFQRAFGHFQSIIQGHSDTKQDLSEDSLRQTIEFCTHAFDTDKEPEQKMTAQRVMRGDDIFHIGNLITDKLEGFQMRVERGKLGLNRV